MPVHGPVDNPGRHKAVTAQAGNEGLRLPATKGRLGPVSLAFRCPSSLLGQLGIGGGLVDKNQPGQSPIEECSAPRDPEMALTGNVNAPAFAGLQAFFYG